MHPEISRTVIQVINYPPVSLLTEHEGGGGKTVTLEPFPAYGTVRFTDFQEIPGHAMLVHRLQASGGPKLEETPKKV